ncbi:MAG: hypothetical protein IPP94_15900 [Ignavibacteria bacterium]|nr:hypothetical protein [Ignavibacteria bacterium]
MNFAGAEIVSASAVLATVTTNATNSFGYSGVFVEADNITISGLRFNPNVPDVNKTIEVIGNGVTVKHCEFRDGGSLYINDWRYNSTTNVSYVTAYTVQGNRFRYGTSVDIASGAGYSGPVSGRLISNNMFTGEMDPQPYWPCISFNGSGTGVPWFVCSVGGATIAGNSFAGSDQQIRARGNYDNSQFSWGDYWNTNSFDRAVAVGVNPPADIRTYSYTSGAYTFPNVRRIGAIIQGEIDHAVDGDIVRVKAGTYWESPLVNKSVILRGDGRDVTSIRLTTGTYLSALTITAPDVTVRDFTIVGYDGADGTLPSTNIILGTGLSTIHILDNRLRIRITEADPTRTRASVFSQRTP